MATQDKSLQRAFRRYRGRIQGDTSGASPRLRSGNDRVSAGKPAPTEWKWTNESWFSTPRSPSCRDRIGVEPESTRRSSCRRN